MNTWYITFGQASPFKDGYVELEAENQFDAFKIANETLGNKWSNCYTEEDMKFNYYPLGRLGRKLK